MNRVIPRRVVHLRRPNDIVSYALESLKKKRDRVFKRARKFGKLEDYEQLKQLNKDIKRVVCSEKSKIVCKKMQNSSPATFWKAVNDVWGRNNVLDEFPLEDSGEKVFEKAEFFSNFFQTKVNKLADLNQVPITSIPPWDSSEDFIQPFSAEEVKNAVDSFKNKRSFGPDDVPMVAFKSGYGIISVWVIKLFNSILQTGKIPCEWKLARLKPIFKKGDPTNVSNYRPISNLNSISKVFERCLLNRLGNCDTLDGCNQHGFRPSHSTTTAALAIQSKLVTAMDQGKECVIYSMDLSAAFDLIRPSILFNELSDSINQSLLKCLCDFTSNRKAYVEVDDDQSVIFEFSAGVPQGSTLGPKLFNLYMRSLEKCLRGADVVSYADDTYVILTADNVVNLEHKIKSTIVDHVRWLSEHGMVCNLDKTEIMHMGRDQSPLVLQIGDVQILPSPTMKVLGLLFDAEMSWSHQVNNLVRKCNRMLHGLRHLKKYLDQKRMSQVMTSFYFSVLYYGAEIFHHRHLSFAFKQRLRSLHYKALKVVYGPRSRDELDQISNRATPDEWVDYSLAKLMINCFNTCLPTSLHQCLSSQSYTERRQMGKIFTYDSSHRRVGRQALANRLSVISRKINFSWLNQNLNPHALRIKLKSVFFKYYKPQFSEREVFPPGGAPNIPPTM